MAERSLNERFVDLEDRMISVESLTRYGTANDLKFYIFDYNPKDELLVRKEVKKLKSRNPDIVEFDLYEMMLDIIDEEGYLEDIQQMEAEYEKDLLLREVFQPLLSVEEDENSFLDKFKKCVPDDGKSIILITGVGKACRNQLQRQRWCSDHERLHGFRFLCQRQGSNSGQCLYGIRRQHQSERGLSAEDLSSV